MTAATLEKPETETSRAEKCSACTFTPGFPHTRTPCKREATTRAFINCPNSHERTRTYCDQHVYAFSSNRMTCMPCLPDELRSWIVLLEPIR